MEAKEREVPDAAITRWLRGDRKETEEGNPGKGAFGKVEEGRPIRGRPGFHAGQSALASRTMCRGEGGSPSQLGCVGRWPGIKDSARAGGRHSGVRLEVSLGVPSLARVTFCRERLAGEAGWVWIYWAATFSPNCGCVPGQHGISTS